MHLGLILDLDLVAHDGAVEGRTLFDIDLGARRIEHTVEGSAIQFDFAAMCISTVNIGIIPEPIIIFILAKLGIATPKRLSKFRRWAYVLAFVVAAIITPTPDPINQTIVAVPIILLYELGALFARLGVRTPKTV